MHLRTVFRLALIRKKQRISVKRRQVRSGNRLSYPQIRHPPPRGGAAPAAARRTEQRPAISYYPPISRSSVRGRFQ